MTGLYYPELELTGALFCAALSAYLIGIRKRTETVRRSYLNCLLLVTCAGFLDVLQRYLLNFDRMNRRAGFPMTVLFSVVLIAELLAAAAFVYYALDQAGAEKKTTALIVRMMQIGMILFMGEQVLNYFGAFSHTINADGVIMKGPLYPLFVLFYPAVYLLTGFVVFFLYRRHYSKTQAIVIFAALVLTASGILFQVIVLPQIPSATFGASVAVYLLYFSLETPPFVELRARLKELEEATLRAEEEKQNAIQEDRGMNEFLANMSHEIRTPLTAILGYDEVILNNAQEEDVREYAIDIQNAGNTLLYIVGDILDFSKIETGDLSLSISEYHLRDVLDNLDNMIRKKARDKGLEYRTVISDTIPDRLLGDGVRVNQILLNLLNNAVKYTERGYAQLTLRAQKLSEDGLLLIADVEDSGIGIREEDMDKLFNAFARFDESKNKGVEGTGLGLAITSRLLELMGGTIVAKSVYGKGSTFTVTIPQIVVDEKPIGLYADDRHDTKKAEEDELLAPEARMLVVDDNLTNRTVVAELLAHTLMKIDMAESGEQCLEMVRECAYDIILMDQMMPYLSGPRTLELCREMGEENRSREAVVIAFTADAVAGARERLLSLGFDDYLSKPVTMQSLIRTISPHLPSGKKLKPGMQGYEEAVQASRARMESGAQKSREQMALEELKGIDLAHALSICGTKEVLLAAVKDFYFTIQSQSDLIERYQNEGDIKNYTIKVHALKSAANFIGARKLSDDAAYLERMGNQNRTEEIKEKTPALIALYRSYLENLKAIDPDYNRQQEKEPITKEELDEVYGEMRLLAEQFEFDGIDAIMETLEGYQIPKEEQPHFQAVRIAVTDVNREALLKLLSGEETDKSLPA